MKQIFIILLTVFFFSCQQDNKGKQIFEIPKIESAANNVCIECTQKIQVQLASCLANATTPEQKATCNAKASNDWINQCKALCNPRFDSTSSAKKGYGECKKCTCKGFREDATDGTCMNIRYPSLALCGHIFADHK